jgi:hypothetical protein
VKDASLSFLLLLVGTGCEDPLKHAQLLEEARVIGVRVVSATDDASLTPGESATVEVLLAGPSGPLDARLAFEFCEAKNSDRGVPYCAREGFARGVVETLTVPLAVELPADVPAGARLAFLGAACETGEPALGPVPLDWRCSEGAEPLRFSFDAHARTPSFSHENPDLSALVLEIGDAEIPLDDPRSAPSCSEGVPVVAARAVHRVTWRVGTLGRDRDEDGAESLQLSHFATTGLFERSLSFIDEVEEPTVRLEWEAPGVDVPAKLYLVVRDGRGGVSWVSASVCAQ